MNTNIFHVKIQSLAARANSLAARLTPRRQELMWSYRNLEDRLRCMAGGLLMERILGGREPHFTEYGKPFLPGGPYFNLSHSGDFACLAASASSPVGIDVEQHRGDDLLMMAQSAFHPAELAFFLENPEIERFYSIWTLKESYSKMVGAGFSLDPKEFCVLPRGTLRKLPSRFAPKEMSCFFHTLHFIEGYSLSFCSEAESEFTIEEMVF
jgi:4'-phosphopantetheinyl transferase